MINHELKSIIQKKNRTQADFAQIAHEYESFVSNVIHGRRELSKEKCKKWRKLLDCRAYVLKPQN